MVTAILALGALGATAVLLYGVIRVTKVCMGALQDILEEIRLERKLLGLQKELVSQINQQITLQRTIIERQLTLAMNAIMSMKLLIEKENDPLWVDKFNEGRDNARWN